MVGWVGDWISWKNSHVSPAGAGILAELGNNRNLGEILEGAKVLNFKQKICYGDNTTIRKVFIQQIKRLELIEQLL